MMTWHYEHVPNVNRYGIQTEKRKTKYLLDHLHKQISCVFFFFLLIEKYSYYLLLDARAIVAAAATAAILLSAHVRLLFFIIKNNINFPAECDYTRNDVFALAFNALNNHIK